KINTRTKKASEVLWKLSDGLRQEKEKAEKQKSEEDRSGNRPASERFGSDIHYLYEVQKELRFFEELSSSTKAKLSNSPFLLLTGLAGTGKTHLLCDVVEERVINKNTFPAILVFGELFETSEDPFVQVARQLGLKLNKSQLLRLLSNAGKQADCRAIIAIDALNETRQKRFWRGNLGKVIEEVKKYPNIALLVSVRTGFEEEVATKKTRKILVHEEHRGFEFREWEAVNKFFKEFDLPLPEIPLLMPEFQNPLFLLLFCKAFQDRAKKNSGKKQKQIFRGHEGATYIFESFVDSVSKRIGKQFNIPNGAGKNIWDTVIEKIAAEIVNKSDDRISEDDVIALVKKAHPSIDHSAFIKELEKNLLIVKAPRYSKEKNDYDGFDFRFPFQKFSDHLIGRYLFKKYEEEFGKPNKNLQTAKKFFSKRRKLGKFLANSWNRGIVEALSIQCPEHLKGCELVEAAPYLKSSQVAQEAFVESLIWRKPAAFSADTKNTLVYINAEIIRTESGHNNLLNAFLAVAPIPDHPFNADFLHKHLSKFSMAKRDSWWSTFLHYQYGEKGAVDRLIEWGWSEQDKTHINDDAVRLCSVALCWFLTTPNRFLRDKATKTLVALLTNRLAVVLALLKQLKDVNDPYVSERLYAVAYSCAIRSKTDSNGLKALSQWVYGEIFKQGNPPAHILLRDYARGIIEVALRKKLKLTVNRKKIEPPFNSDWPKRVPSEKLLKSTYYPEDFFQKKPRIEDFWMYGHRLCIMPEHWATLGIMYSIPRLVIGLVEN
ncbi:MAG: ATP-binding protein, partial [Patescibacteria group bacterium]|nr:ATP-binding protein [Patescibacteria group bacterium]